MTFFPEDSCHCKLTRGSWEETLRGGRALLEAVATDTVGKILWMPKPQLRHCHGHDWEPDRLFLLRESFAEHRNVRIIQKNGTRETGADERQAAVIQPVIIRKRT